MLTNFLRNTCNITRQVITNTSGVESQTLSSVYTGIKCYFYEKKGRLEETNVGLNTDIARGNCLIEPDKINVNKLDLIEIIDPDLGILGKYQIDAVIMNRLMTGNDSITLKLTAI